MVFDLDGTLIQGTVFIWQTLHDALGTDRARRAAAKEAFFAGQITYKEWFEHDLELLAAAGATRERLLAALGGVAPTPGAHETLLALRRAGCKLAVLSGSLDLVLERSFGDVPFDEVLINRLHFDPVGRIAGGVHTPFDIDHKGAGLREIARRQGLSLREVAFVGDNFNDVSAARAAGLAIAFNPRSEDLEAAADVVIREPDLRALLPHLI